MPKFPAWIEEVLDQLHPHDVNTDPILEALTRINGLLREAMLDANSYLYDRIEKETKVNEK